MEKILIGMAIGGAVVYLSLKFTKTAIYVAFWLLGWNDRSKAKAYKSKYTENTEFCKSCFSAKPKNYPCLTKGCAPFASAKTANKTFGGIDRIGAATNKTHFKADDEDGF